ncbi:acyl-CoA dehydrogenase family protein [Craterilacuibacter sp. RT1T]|uniref:acyl-CoA dehydrogenase family protein n=1 Tax=Craterilacuibacter sp. RT1T TaxID=2942211 RepID=UPI0020BE8D12|nr:acyl-CoA dehydrogenase family protein [Craterilacuibacter sp. RT1T]MCL6263272.1 acyl-CoA/acyl-ACP dehydrogenase [Craterilacuibacter sp. RT1T]
MDFTYTDDQRAFRDAMRALFMVEASPERVREGWEMEGGISPQLQALIAGQGLCALSVPEAHGGLGLADTDWALMSQEFGYYAVPDAPLNTGYLAASLIAALPDAPSFQAHWLPAIAQGQARVAISHPLCPLVADAGQADLLLVWRDEEVHAIARSEVDVSAVASVDPARRLYRVSLPTGAATRLATAAQGQALWRDLVNRASLAICGQLLGLTQRILDISIDYTAQRKQFGKPIGSFQAVKHHMADVAVKSEFAKPVLNRAAWALEQGHPLRDVYVSQARLACAEAARLAARNGIQVHGAMGYTWECDLQIFMKRIWALDAAWGDAGFHKARVANWLFSPGAEIGPGKTFI